MHGAADISARNLSDDAVAKVVFGFAEKAQTATTVDEVTKALARDLQASFGIERFILFHGADRRGRLKGQRVFGVFNDPWYARYNAAGMAKHDQLLKQGLVSVEPTTWRKFRSGTEITPDQAAIFNAASDFGLRDGFFLPIHQLDGSMYGVAMMVERPIEETSRTIAALHMLALYYSASVRRLCADADGLLFPPEEPKIALTPRQRECLQWVRAGKTDWEIGQILGISEHTVIEHLEQARRRLGVATRTQAVIEAIALGLIHL